jgi:hypothetical protein
MSVPARPLYHGNNAFIQADGSVGYRCCGGNSSLPRYIIQGLGPIDPDTQRRLLVYQGINPDEPWCRRCSTVLEDARDGFEEAGPLLISMVASIASFIPGLGTAVAVALRSGLALAQGADISDAFVEGVKAALPGGVVTEIAFNAGQAALNGEDIQNIVLAGLPVPPLTETIKAGLRIAVALADGDTVDVDMVNAAYGLLPEYGQQAVLRALANGDGRSLADLVCDQTQDELPPHLRTGLIAGIAIGQGQAHQAGTRQFIGTFDNSEALEQDVAAHDKYAAEGRRIIASGAKWRGRLLSDIRASSRLTFLQDGFDVKGNPQARIEVLNITDQWRRGFDIAIGACEGRSENGPGQDQVYHALGAGTSRAEGFDVGRTIQHARALGNTKVTPAVGAEERAARFLAALQSGVDTSVVVSEVTTRSKVVPRNLL